MNHIHIDSPVGELTLIARGGRLVAIHFPPGAPPAGSVERSDAVLDATAAQLREYFAGERTAFDLPLELDGTPFQQEAWRALADIPYGKTVSYGEQARRLGRPDAVRAVGAANGRNPIPIVLPCHRVIGADGSLTGFGGGLEAKRTLLDLEQSPSLF
ncbi:MAG: methylated-DNA--[protein]-cysteine S-methyltransferase [Solirubrobacteraceae bacterium]